MNNNSFTEYNLPQNAYLTFDAITLKSLIIQKLNESNIFRDQVFEGSNLNAFIDIVSYMYHVLLFYLNTTSAEGTFTTATLYENINKLISNINYKPLGAQTSLATVSLTAQPTLSPGQYTIPRFSFINPNGVVFTAIRDISFEKTNTLAEPLAIDNNILYQGSLVENPIYTARGENFETITIINKYVTENRNTADENTIPFIADNTFSVFVKDPETNKWSEWVETSSLYLETPLASRYEKRLNENSNYEFKFGNDVNGKALKPGSLVQIYYILSNNQSGVVSANVLKGAVFRIYNTNIFDEIKQQIYPSTTTFLPVIDANKLVLTNNNDTTAVVSAETVEEIKANAPKIFSLQNRLVTSTDYESFITRNFNNVIKSVKILSNNDFAREYLRYFYSIGLNKPNDDNRVLFNQVNYSSSTMFNNVYVFSIPLNTTILNEKYPNYLNPTQKQLLINECNIIKDITHNVVPVDPIYKAFSLGVIVADEKPCVNLKDNTVLVIKKSRNVTINESITKNKVVDIFKTAFNELELGSIVDLNVITNQILNLPGVDGIATRRTDIAFEVPLINCVVWNPAYEVADVICTSQNYQLANFQYAYWYEISKLVDNIVVELA